jgi:hypothetical protein
LVTWDWKSFISALFGSGFIVFILTSLYSNFINTPIIHIENNSYSISKPYSINVTNIGLAPATHLKLTINAGKITSHQIFNTENFTEKYNYTTRLLDIYVPRFTTGTGSRLSINVSTDAKSNITSPTIFATYDQGSTRKPRIVDISDSYRSFLPILIPAIGAAVSFLILIERINSKESLRYIAAKIYIDVSKVIKAFKDNPNNETVFVDEKARPVPKQYSTKLWGKPSYGAMKRFFSETDIVLIHNFFCSLIERDSVIKKRNWEKERTAIFIDKYKANTKLKENAEKAYKCIIWDRYTGFKFLKKYLLSDDLENPDDIYKSYRWIEKLGSIKEVKYLIVQGILVLFIIVIVLLPA